ncbi:kinase/pyrophosphorylase, partial [Pseudomonas aeruginosa]|nr:kinase/pyrophosphorylase [Pseudomonas aeruginosa]
MKEQQAQQLTIYIVSDSIGETAQRMIHATLTQFPDLTQIEIKKFPYIKDENEFLNVLELAHEKNAIVVTTLVSESFNALGHQYAKEHQIS